MYHCRGFLICVSGALALVHLACGQPAPAPADAVYRHGTIFTAGAQGAAQSLAIRDGRIVYVGADEGLVAYVGPATKTVELAGGFVMPGLTDGHMHPLEAGTQLLKCSLNYEPLTVAQLQARVQACLDKRAAREPDAWLEVVSWFQESMLPVGVRTSKATLDVLKTQRPIIVRSSFGHTVLANSRALALAKITAATKDPVGGKIWREVDGAPSGLLEDAAFLVFGTLIPKPTAAEDRAAARAALAAMRSQGVTSFLDAWAPAADMAAFTAMQKAGTLTARAHFAPEISPKEAHALPAAVARVLAFRAKYDQGALVPAPAVTVRNAKLFLDGVIAAPALTGAVLEPYRRNAGTADMPQWVAGTSRGPAVYFDADALASVLIALGRAGIDPHMHADGDGAVHAALDGIEALRKALPGADIRPAIAHDELVGPADFGRYRQLDATPVISFQWDKPAGDTLGLVDYFGPERMRMLEPAGLLAQPRARGSRSAATGRSTSSTSGSRSRSASRAPTRRTRRPPTAAGSATIPASHARRS